MLKTFIIDESGAALVEYSLLVGLIAVIAIGAVQLLGTHIATVFNTVNSALSSSGLCLLGEHSRPHIKARFTMEQGKGWRWSPAFPLCASDLRV